ncbi:MAG: TonB-dependent receptor [Bacteroidetes bacterium]|nr:TonB-dependent receptor [Bacteroidota bacterium]
MKKLFVLLLFGLFVPASWLQAQQITGLVRSTADLRGLEDAEVTVKNSQVRTMTDRNGRFRLGIAPSDTLVLIIRHPDHETLELPTGGKSDLDIVLQSNIRYNQYMVRVNRNPLTAEERNGILVLESQSGDYRMWFDIRVQTDGAVFSKEVMNPIGNGTSIRRARFATKVRFSKSWYAELDLDFSNSELELKDAYLEYTFRNGLELKAGNFKEGFSMESTTTSRYLTFIERPMVISAFAPSRHIGMAATYGIGPLLGIGGIHFQSVGDVEERAFSEDNNKNTGTDEGISYTGKLVYMPFYQDPYQGLHFGVSGSYRTPKTDAEVPGTMRFSTRSNNSINRKKYIDTDLIANVDHSTLAGLEFAAYRRNIRLQGEYVMNNVYLKNDLPAEKFDGWYAMGSALLFGGKYNYNTTEGEFTQVGRGKKWGDVEIALRYDYLNMNTRDEGKIMGGAGEAYTAGLNFYPNNNVKIMLNYAFINHDRYANGKGKLFVGKDSAGNLTKNPALVADPKGKAGEDFHMFAIRLEVDF